jgi:hypothetical protein
MFLITVDVNSKVGAEKIARLKRIHETRQDPVVVTYTDTSIPDGYTIMRFDGLLKHLVKSEPKYAEDVNVKKAMHEQNERLSKEKFVNR